MLLFFPLVNTLFAPLFIVYSITMNNSLCVLVSLLPKAINFEHWLPKVKKKLHKFCSLDLKPGNCLAAWDTAIFPIFPASGHSCNTGLNWPNTSKSSISDVSLGFSSRSGFLSISKLNMCKANLFSLASRAGGNWIHAMLKPLVGEKGGVVQHLFFLNGFVYFSLPSIFSFILV